jgi:hypothetical protein
MSCSPNKRSIFLLSVGYANLVEVVTHHHPRYPMPLTDLHVTALSPGLRHAAQLMRKTTVTHNSLCH